jgi:hypothetical protein
MRYWAILVCFEMLSYKSKLYMYKTVSYIATCKIERTMLPNNANLLKMIAHISNKE